LLAASTAARSEHLWAEVTHVVPAGLDRSVSAVVLTVKVLEPALAKEGAEVCWAARRASRARTWASWARVTCGAGPLRAGDGAITWPGAA
jgi:hypothetical protein